MAIFLSTVKDAVKDITEVYVENYHIEDGDAIKKIKTILKKHFQRLRDDLHIIIETNYVDRMYRDIFYHYFSTKLDSYPRNCIRISLFDREITENLFYDKKVTEEVRKKREYLGFYVLRPTFPQIIGRNVISPKALKGEYNNFKTCTTCFSMTAAGVKFDVIGFPHASQDGEMICCADVTIWAIMEYFGNKYPEYAIINPSKTMSSLRNISFERQLPTTGLQIESISYALREQGFGPKIYSKDVYKKDFFKIFSCYIEGGIPLVVAIENYLKASDHESNHALICTGHVIEDFEKYKQEIEEGLKKDQESHPGKKVNIYDWDSIEKEFIFVDDNLPVYNKASLNKPVLTNSKAKITHFIAPLYPKIYLDAYAAKKQIIKYIEQKMFFLIDDYDKQTVLRTFLSSGRSYKQYIAHNSEIDINLQDIIINLELPKFVWIGELSTPELVCESKVNGLVILDATEPGFHENKSLMLIANSTRVVYKQNDLFNDKVFGEYKEISDENGEIQIIGIPLRAFKRFESNIKSF